jgi:hypothetical protein
MPTLLRQPLVLALSAIAISLVSAGGQTLPAASAGAERGDDRALEAAGASHRQAAGGEMEGRAAHRQLQGAA